MKHYFVFSDIHGNGKIFDQIVNYMESFEGDYYCYFLGDAADRGENGYRIIKHMLNDPEHFLYLKGNHEDLFVKAAKALNDMAKLQQMSISYFLRTEHLDVSDLAMMDDDILLYYHNGGRSTFEHWIKDGAPMTLISRLEQLPLTAAYDKYDMCHAGCTIQDWENHNEESLLWDRSHFYDPWYENRILIHGHTPVRSMPVELRKYTGGSIVQPLVYCDKSKIDLDNCCALTGVSNLFYINAGVFLTFYEDEFEEMNNPLIDF